ncbi:MAG: hypothetical protein ACXADC_12170 [Candidatus Thorarchaeota archaeon]|jgi:hypothetical protein
MTDLEKANDNVTSDEIASEIIDAVEEDQEEEDALTKGERKVEERREAERVRKAKELKKQLRRRELGLLQYRWPAIVLVLTGVLSIWTEFSVVMIHDPGIGFDTFWSALFLSGNPFFLFPLLAGGLLIVLGYFAYSNPKATYVSVLPAMMMAMAGMNVYFLISFGLQVNPDALLMSTGTPLTMLLTGLLSLLSILLREKV